MVEFGLDVAGIRLVQLSVQYNSCGWLGEIIISLKEKLLLKLTEAAEVGGSLVPGPFLTDNLLLKGWRELHRDVAGLEELPAHVDCLTLVQSVVRPVDLLDDEPGALPGDLALGVVRGRHHLLRDGDPRVVPLLAQGESFTEIN